jgi:type IV secretory pathway TrbD component
MWFLVLAVLLTIFLVTSWQSRPQLGIGVVVPLAFLFPAWLLLPLFDVPDGTIVGQGVDEKLAIGTLALILYCFLPRANFPISLTVCDLAMLGLAIVHVASDLLNDGLKWATPMRIYGEWWVPYVTGRIAFQYRSDLWKLMTVVAIVSVVLALVAILEGVTLWNIYEAIYGLRPPEQNPRMLFRWGMKRAYGPTLNPVYFGALQLLLLAGPLGLSLRALQRKANVAWCLTPVLALAGIVATGSRGPILVLPFLVSVIVACMIPKSRKWLAIAGIAGVVALAAQREQVIRVLETWSNETLRVGSASRVVVNEGDERSYSGTRNRLVLFELYSIAMRRSGLLGYGTEAVTGFPVRVPLGTQEVETLRRIRFIDNTYILLILRFGYLGLVCFCIACFAAVAQCIFLAHRYRIPNRILGQGPAIIASCFAGVLVATMIVLLSVWMPQDYGFALLWFMGASSGLTVAHRLGSLNATSEAS